MGQAINTKKDFPEEPVYPASLWKSFYDQKSFCMIG